MKTGRIKNGNIRTEAENIYGFSDIEYINSARWWIFYAEE